jgi:transcriptional regulator with XRE-family HTH domain
LTFNHDPAYVDLLKKLKTKRKELDWTQVDLGKVLGRPQAYVAKVETGNQRVDLLEFHRWATALRLDPTALVEELYGALEAFPRKRVSIASDIERKEAPRKRVRLLKPLRRPQS